MSDTTCIDCGTTESTGARGVTQWSRFGDDGPRCYDCAEKYRSELQERISIRFADASNGDQGCRDIIVEQGGRVLEHRKNVAMDIMHPSVPEEEREATFRETAELLRGYRNHRGMKYPCTVDDLARRLEQVGFELLLVQANLVAHTLPEDAAEMFIRRFVSTVIAFCEDRFATPREAAEFLERFFDMEPAWKKILREYQEKP